LRVSAGCVAGCVDQASCCHGKQWCFDWAEVCGRNVVGGALYGVFVDLEGGRFGSLQD
jgi:hypothetical protein